MPVHKKEIWIDKRSSDILQAPYFCTVFTMSQELHMLIYQNQELLYNLMQKAIAQTLVELLADLEHLGAQKTAALIFLVRQPHF